LCQDLNAKELQALLAEWSSEEKSLTIAEVTDLVGHVFAAYTMGPAYGCAALLLRLEPHSGSDGATIVHSKWEGEDSGVDSENKQLSGAPRDRPLPARNRTPVRDLDRARLVTSVLAETGASEDSGFAQAVVSLRHLWNGTAETLASTTPAYDAAAASSGVDWLSNFQADVLSVLRRLGVRPFTDSRWHAVRQRSATIAGETNSTLEETPGDLLEVLNALWSVRLQGENEPNALAAEATRLWDQRRRPPQTPGYMQRRPA
jgi:hypothetical protein